jgi:thiamine pyrophosphokinase
LLNIGQIHKKNTVKKMFIPMLIKRIVTNLIGRFCWRKYANGMVVMVSNPSIKNKIITMKCLSGYSIALAMWELKKQPIKVKKMVVINKIQNEVEYTISFSSGVFESL